MHLMNKGFLFVCKYLNKHCHLNIIEMVRQGQEKQPQGATEWTSVHIFLWNIVEFSFCRMFLPLRGMYHSLAPF